MMGGRQMDSDGFTYVYGKYKEGRKKRTRNKNQTKRNIRADKRAAKAKAIKRIKKETEID